MRRQVISAAVVLLVILLQARGLGADASVEQTGQTFILSTALVEQTVQVRDGKLLLTSLKDKSTTRQLITTPIDQSPLPGPWTLADVRQARLHQSELQLDLLLDRPDGLRATCHFILYPGSSIIRQSTTFTNTSLKPIPISDPPMLTTAAIVGPSPDFLWMTGGENQPGQWTLKTEALNPNAPRIFDSFDPFSGNQPAFPGDGVDVRIDLNDKQIWPARGWQYIPNASVTIPLDLKLNISAGDRLAFRVNLHGNIGWDTTAFDPTIAYADGESHTASKEFSSQQGNNNWRYVYAENGQYVDLVYYPGPIENWRKKTDNATHTPFVDATGQHPDVNQDAIRLWTAPKAGPVRITASISNSGNRSTAAPKGFRPGSSTYAPWYALYDKQTRQGCFIGFDYFGHWSSRFTRTAQTISINLNVAGFKQNLAPGQSLHTPWAFLGLYHDDLDNAGNALLDWQYQYLWDYTRDGSHGEYPWFPALRTLGYWYKGTGWGKPGVSWTGGDPDLLSTYRKVFRVADYMRATGTDVYHRDWGWWDVAGDWNGPDFRSTGDYLRKSGMGQLIYAFLYTVDAKSRVAREHPDWLAGGLWGGSTLDLSRPEVVRFITGQLDAFADRWGTFEWRNDSTFTAPRPNDDSVLLGQDQGFRLVLKTFLDAHPDCAFQAVNGGGNYASYDYLRYASNVQFSDGVIGPLRNYWSSLLFPPDKNCDNPDQWDPNHYDKAKWRGLLCFNYDTTGDTIDPAKLDGIRELNDIYHYLLAKGVVGRWVHVYRPRVDGDDPTMWFERMSRDSQRGIIIPKHIPPGPITIFPKGLLPDHAYTVSFQESPATQERTGADLMASGIRIDKMPPGELIYLNLPLHPGSKLDKTPPTAPAPLSIKLAENMAFPGLELTWKPATDDNWISYYELFRDDILIDKIAKGTYYFDHSAHADPHAKYEIRTIDGAGNASPKATFAIAPGPRATILTHTQGLTFTGQWTHNANLASTTEKGASIDATVTGQHLLLFSQLGPTCGQFSISVDGQAPETVDTYCADDLYDIPIWHKTFPTAARHTLRITILAQHNPRSSGNTVHIQALRAEQP